MIASMGPITSMSPKGRVVFATGLALFVLVFNVFYGAILVQDRRTKKFPATIGTVLGTQLDSKDYSDPDGAGGVQYRGLVHYAYSINGRSYESRRVRVSNMYGSLASTQKFLSQYRPGQKINVYYDPANPAYAVLLTGLQDDWQMLCFAARKRRFGGRMGLGHPRISLRWLNPPSRLEAHLRREEPLNASPLRTDLQMECSAGPAFAPWPAWRWPSSSMTWRSISNPKSLKM